MGINPFLWFVGLVSIFATLVMFFRWGYKSDSMKDKNSSFVQVLMLAAWTVFVFVAAIITR